MNNAEFAAGLRRHDPAAAKHLHECFVPLVWRYVCQRVGGDVHLAEDIVSEAVLALVAAIGEGVEIEYPSAWLRAVATRRVQDHYRAAARVQHLIQQAGVIAEFSVQETPQSELEKQHQRQEVREAMQRLPEPQQLVLHWKYVDRLPVREIAARLDSTEKSAESLLFRARNGLRRELKKNTPAPSTECSTDTACDQADPHHDRPCLSITPETTRARS